MPSSSKRKGNTYEREIVDQAKALDLHAVRAWGSNGQALGHHEEVDCLIAGQRIQAKRRAKIADYIVPSEHVDAQVVRADRGESFAILRYSDYLELLKNQRNNG